ncbi:ead/Ea22-like family protein [Trabulsiella odontotermitis]|uniref:ead/Ea22-like family protein n=1 Tax=Trabulsiella odontotermitis TaxID=379893 RepID=UPI0006767EBB|nr:ead/Ea22-like family protein [Trabulsiella odontotermitis]
MSNIDKQALRERYSLKAAPLCKICGGKMSISTASYKRATYVCYGVFYDEGGHHYANGRSLGDEHYEQSKITLVDTSDDEVIALLDELEAAEHTAAVDHEAACSLVVENEELKRKLAAAVPEECPEELRNQIIDICDGIIVGDVAAQMIWDACRATGIGIKES